MKTIKRTCLEFWLLLLLPLAGMACALSATAQEHKAFLGKWDIQGTAPHEEVVYWLEVKDENGALSGWFLNRVSSVYKLPAIKIENNEIVFSVNDKPGAPVHRAKVVGGKLLGSVTVNNETINWIGVRPPKWSSYDANAKHKFGAPVELFDGQSLDHWTAQVKNKPLGWKIEDGVMTNQPHANNLVSKQRFQDFKVHCEYKLEANSNSGIYLRGRYELQVLDDYGKPTEAHGHMSLYSRAAPRVNASKPTGEWQTMEATIVGNRVTVTLNGQLVQDNLLIEGLTGGALDANEGAPGPLVIQGDHQKVYYRRITVTPVIK